MKGYLRDLLLWGPVLIIEELLNPVAATKREKEVDLGLMILGVVISHNILNGTSLLLHLIVFIVSYILGFLGVYYSFTDKILIGRFEARFMLFGVYLGALFS